MLLIAREISQVSHLCFYSKAASLTSLSFQGREKGLQSMLSTGSRRLALVLADMYEEMH